MDTDSGFTEASECAADAVVSVLFFPLVAALSVIERLSDLPSWRFSEIACYARERTLAFIARF